MILEQWGLIGWIEATRVRLPLKGVQCQFAVQGSLATVTMEQVFKQDNLQPINCEYRFPLPADAAVYSCEVEIDGRLIRAQVKEREAARELAETKKREGHRTALVEMERANLFTLELGNAQPGDLIVVRLGYFQPVRRLGDEFSLEIPFCPGVRYIPGRPLLRSNKGSGPVDDTDQVPDASRLNPVRTDDSHPDAAYMSLEGFISGLDIPAASIASPTHSIRAQNRNGTIEIDLAQADAIPDRDFVVRWLETAPSDTTLRAYSTDRDGWKYSLLELRAPQAAMSAQSQPVDIYFLIDESGSMRGVKWRKAIQALTAATRVLRDCDRADIIFYSNSHRDFAEGPLPPGQLLRDPAFADLERVFAGGGTELLGALTHALGKARRLSAERRAVIALITDGQVGNEDAIINIAVAQPIFPIHCFGIDVATNDALLAPLSRRTGGAFYSLKPDDDIPKLVTRLAETFQAPVLTHLHLPGGVELADQNIPDLFAGQTRYAAIRSRSDSTALTIKAVGRTGATIELPFQSAAALGAAPLLTWHKQKIDSLLESGRSKEAVQLSEQANIICRLTAFIAWDERERMAVATHNLVQPSMEYDPKALVAVAAAPGAARRLAGGGPSRGRIVDDGSAYSAPAAAAEKALLVEDFIRMADAGLAQEIQGREARLLQEFERFGASTAISLEAASFINRWAEEPSLKALLQRRRKHVDDWIVDLSRILSELWQTLDELRPNQNRGPNGNSWEMRLAELREVLSAASPSVKIERLRSLATQGASKLAEIKAKTGCQALGEIERGLRSAISTPAAPVVH